MVARGFQSASHPILAQIVPIRRCNLACTYCNEYDTHSPPVALATMRERIDHLARLRTANIEISGGEPLLHPDLDDLIRHIRGTGALAGLITNGYLLNEKRIERFNNAGLDHLQISIDNVKPDDVSKKSLKVLDAKLQMLATARRVQRQHQLCSRWRLESARGRTDDREAGDRTGSHGDRRPDPQRSRPPVTADAGAAARLHRDHLADCAVLHGTEPERFPANLAFGRPNDWQCGAGGRYLYICEDGLVHWCSQQRGYPGVPLADYTTEDVRRESTSEKSCAPLCTVSCVHRVALLDRIRTQPIKTLDEMMPASASGAVNVRVLRWMFVTGRHHNRFRAVAARLLGSRS